MRRKVFVQFNESIAGARPSVSQHPQTQIHLTVFVCCTQLLNTTVASIALTANEVLTHSYNAIYGTADDATELILMTAPLTATSEVQELYTAGIIDFQSAMPASLHSLGYSAEEIASAMERRRLVEETQETLTKQRETTEVDELKARSKLAKNPPKPATEGSSSAAPAPKPKAAKPAPTKPAPTKPASESGGD